MNSVNLSDLESLVLNTRNEKTKSYISEALLCYNVGAFRACIVYTWIATTFDIVNKIQELSISGDKRAQQLLTNFDGYRQQIEDGNLQGVSSALKFERELLVYANEELELIDKLQHGDLERLREDRHKCAHPTFTKDDILFVPSAEQARMHMRNALVYLLTQPPVQGKSALNSILQLIASSYFPQSIDSIVKEFEISPLKNASPILVKSFLETLFFDIFSDEKKFTKNVISIINACRKLHPIEVRKCLLNCCNKHFTKIKDDEFHMFIYVIFSFDDVFWNDLDDCVKTRIVNFLTPENKFIDKIGYSIVKMNRLKTLAIPISNFIKNASVSTIRSILSIEPTSYKIFSKEIVDRYSKTIYQWNEINQLAKLITENEHSLDKDDVMKILETMPNSVDRLSSVTLKSVIRTIYKISDYLSIDKTVIDSKLDEANLSSSIVDDETYKELIKYFPF